MVLIPAKCLFFTSKTGIIRYYIDDMDKQTTPILAKSASSGSDCAEPKEELKKILDS